MLFFLPGCLYLPEEAFADGSPAEAVSCNYIDEQGRLAQQCAS